MHDCFAAVLRPKSMLTSYKLAKHDLPNYWLVRVAAKEALSVRRRRDDIVFPKVTAKLIFNCRKIHLRCS